MSAPATGVAAFLEAVYRRFHSLAHVAQDPIRVPRRFHATPDREVMAFVASAFAFGRVATFLRVLDSLAERVGPSPAATLAGAGSDAIAAMADGFGHRFARPAHVAALLAAMGRMVREDGGLRPAFDAGFRRSGDVVDGLASLSEAVRAAAPAPGPGFLVATVSPANPAKRLNLFLRWMVRDDGLDLGDWRDVGAHRLLVPLDVHVARTARRLGLLPARKSGPRLADARALAEALRAFDPADPVRFDFALSHLGISGECRGRPGDAACGRCAVAGECRARDLNPDDLAVRGF